MNSEHLSGWSQIVAKARADDQFKQRLLADPAAVLKENGVTLPEGVTVQVVDNAVQLFPLTPPPKLQGELTEAELESVAAGRSWVDPEPTPINRTP